ncbi:helix-turn-helix domain-containing protein [Selenomonas sp. KH1T6]|uniref:helix-turn-helix domain-containing protein n=1 Tax=Selenomonas sp. KH1T6 TaxID=3158784 RepID=UPI0008A7DA1F|nr:AraC-type DNA-binding protein [Selenomonas ruminantium]
MSGSKHEIVATNLPLGIRFYESKVETDGYVPFHWHNSVEILCVLEGSLRLNVNGQPHTVGAEECIAVSSGLIHDVANTPNRALVLQVPLGILNPFVKNPAKLQFNLQKNRNEQAYAEVVADFVRLNEILKEKSCGYLFDAEITLMGILKRLVLDFTEKEQIKSRIGKPIRDVVVHINEHYKEQITVPELARLSGYNANYLSRLFHEQMGMPLTEYIYRVRLAAFYKALLESDGSIGELMLEYGLKNERTAREMFRKIYGSLPLEVRKRYQQ